MLKGISKLLTGDLLKALCDMGHGDELVIADANFPAEAVAKRLVRCPGIDAVTLTREILRVFPVDTYTPEPAAVMELTPGDRAKGMPTPGIWAEYEALLRAEGETGSGLGKLERFAFYERAKGAYLVIQTGEERQYGNLLLVKGVVL